MSCLPETESFLSCKFMACRPTIIWRASCGSTITGLTFYQKAFCLTVLDVFFSFVDMGVAFGVWIQVYSLDLYM